MKDYTGYTLTDLAEEIEDLDLQSISGPLSNALPWIELRRRLARQVAQRPENMISAMMALVERFNVDLIGIEMPERPTILSFDRGEARLKHIREELTELEEAISDENLEDQADAILDLTYVALGALVEMGMSPLPVFEVVHEANMRKHAGTVDKRPENVGHDAIKPEGWKPPNLAPYLTVTKADLDDVLFAKDMDNVEGLKDDHALARHPKHKTVIPYPNRRILVLGHARHGKDTVGEMLRDKYGLSFTSSSEFCAATIVWPILQLEERAAAFMGSLPPDKSVKLGYELDAMRRKNYRGPTACFDDRGNHRGFWYEAIRAFNTPDLTALGRAIFDGNEVYCGLRHHSEFHALRNAGVFDVAVWVDGQERHPPESTTSCSVEPWMADYVLDNNGTLEDLERNLTSLMNNIILKGSA